MSRSHPGQAVSDDLGFSLDCILSKTMGYLEKLPIIRVSELVANKLCCADY